MASGTYTATTLGQALTLLAERMMDPTFVRWTAAELTIYVQQAIRTWNALTGFYRDRGSFQTTVNEPFYGLPAVLPALRGQTYTTTDALTEITYHLLEPPPDSGECMSGQYSLEEIAAAVQYARDRMLLLTGIVVTDSQVTVDPVPSTGRIPLSEDIANVRRISWETPTNGIITILRRTDGWGLTNYLRATWNTPSDVRPQAYSVGETPPLVVQIAPVPTTAATLRLLSINRGAAVSATETVSLGVPNDWAWVVIYGALMELLNKDGLAYDPARASYCQSRWEHGIATAKAAAVVYDALISGRGVNIASVQGADSYASAWPMQSATPQRILTAGHTVVACAPPPGVPVGGGQYTVTLDLVRNAPVPVASGDYLQVGPELLDTILDYAQHLAVFKEGAAAIQQSSGLLEKFMGMAGTEISREWALSPNRVSVRDQTAQDTRQVPYETSAAGTIN